MTTVSYSQEPERLKTFTINQKEPFNAEPPVDVLRQHFVTPAEHFYVRNHAPVPSIDDMSHRIRVEGLIPSPCDLSVHQLRTNYEQVTLMATLMCAGNRRTEMSKIKTVKGVGWGHAAISNAIWTGPKLRDILISAGIEKLKPMWDHLHVEFEGVDICKNNQGYGSSVPISKVMDPRGDVILAMEMNGDTLPRDHGYPVRVVVPGYIGARSVKWLKTIRVLAHESENYFQKNDYKLFPSYVDWDVVDDWWDRSPPIQEVSVQAAVCHPKEGEMIASGGKYTINGYALTGGGRRITRVDISVDGGKTWDVAHLFSSLHNQKVHAQDTKWSWEFWDLPVTSLKTPCQIVCRAWDESSNTMPEDLKQIWNLRGVMNNSWVRVNVKAKSKV